ncbi:MAG: SDR family oxidoreductase [Gammaproteobacteria bacterium]|nr:MAG: SDR family oxidoreductase [Gammaproteobacteria bacterium]
MKTLLITGGTGKFGSVLVEHFLRKDFYVIFTSTSDEKIKKLIDDYSGLGGEITGLKVDFTDENSVKSVVCQLLEKGLYVDYLINNARSIASLAIEADGRVLRKNFLAEYLLDVVVPYELTVELAHCNSSSLKSVVNIGSQYGIVAANPKLYSDHAQQSPIHYGLAKAALVHLTKELAVRLAKHKIRVNCVAYGGVDGRVDESFRDRYANLVPNKRMLSESEIPGPIEFLLGEESSAMTGQVICADGGWTIW